MLLSVHMSVFQDCVFSSSSDIITHLSSLLLTVPERLTPEQYQIHTLLHCLFEYIWDIFSFTLINVDDFCSLSLQNPSVCYESTVAAPWQLYLIPAFWLVCQSRWIWFLFDLNSQRPHTSVTHTYARHENFFYFSCASTSCLFVCPSHVGGHLISGTYWGEFGIINLKNLET